MGVVNSGLMPAAILYDNPGIDKYEFTELLNNVQIKSIPGRDDSDYEGVDTLHDWETTHKGLFGLSEILKLDLEIRRNYLPFSVDESKNYNESSGGLHVIPRANAKRFFDPVYQVSEFLGYEERGERKTGGAFWTPEVGQILTRDGKNKILDFKENGTKKDYLGNEHPIYEIGYVSLNPKFNVDTYFSLEELVKFHPELNPEDIIDWNKENGGFNMMASRRVNFAHWTQSNGKYYLENPLDWEEHNFSDLIVTSEMIRKESWKMFGFRGYEFIEKYLAENQDVDVARKQGIFDYNTNKDWKAKLSNKEFMRKRLECGSQNFKSDDDRHALHDVLGSSLWRNFTSPSRFSDHTLSGRPEEPFGPSRERTYPPETWSDLHLDLAERLTNYDFTDEVPDYMALRINS